MSFRTHRLHIIPGTMDSGPGLDAEPELLFGLRKVDAKELVTRAGQNGAPAQTPPGVGRILDSSKPAEVFGIDLGGAYWYSRSNRTSRP